MLNKILYSANGVLSDMTSILEDYYNGTKAFTFSVAQDAIYIGSKFPFTRKFFIASVANSTVSATASISYWDGSAWRLAVEIDDGTSVGGKPFGQSGYLSFVPDKQYSWFRDDTTINGTGRIPGLTSVTIYDMYWIKLTYSGAVPATLAWFGDLFCSEDDLKAEYPELGRAAVMTAFLSGKTSWEEQRMVASDLAIADLKRLGITASPGKVLTHEQMLRPVVSKAAELIFTVLEGFQASAVTAAAEYRKRMDSRVFDIDENNNGMDDPHERDVKVHRATR